MSTTPPRPERIRIDVGEGLSFVGRLEWDRAPRTCAAFTGLLPFRNRLIQARWSGQAAWIPLGDFQLDVGTENATSRPSPGEILFHPGGVSETEILFPYGTTVFASVRGQLSGNHFLTLVEGLEQLEELGRRVLWLGAQDVAFTVETAAF